LLLRRRGDRLEKYQLQPNKQIPRKKALISVPVVSVIIISYNRIDKLRETLGELQKQYYQDFEVIVVDNNSHDGSPQLIEEQFTEVKLIKLPHNIGIAARNRGIEISRGEFIVLMDDDAVLKKDWIENAVRHFHQEPSLGILASKVLNYNSGEIWGWVYGVDVNTFADKQFEVFDFVACAAAIKKSALEKAGLFSEELFIYWDEDDLSIRIIDSGYTIWYCPDLVAYHRIPSSQNSMRSKRSAYYRTRNAIWYYWEYYPVWVAAIVSFCSIPYHLSSALRYRCLWSSLKGVLDAFIGMPEILKKRRPVRKETWRKAASPKVKRLLRI
jgi:GT2 family glycosyltransferase